MTLASRIAAPFWWLTGWLYGYRREERERERERLLEIERRKREERAAYLERRERDIARKSAAVMDRYMEERRSAPRPQHVILAMNRRDRYLRDLRGMDQMDEINNRPLLGDTPIGGDLIAKWWKEHAR